MERAARMRWPKQFARMAHTKGGIDTKSRGDGDIATSVFFISREAAPSATPIL